MEEYEQAFFLSSHTPCLTQQNDQMSMDPTPEESYAQIEKEMLAISFGNNKVPPVCLIVYSWNSHLVHGLTTRHPQQLIIQELASTGSCLFCTRK